MNLKTLSVKCPTCQKEVLMTPDYPNRPFCSKRCQLIDLGEWASENHRIPTDESAEDLWSDTLERERDS